MSELIVIGYDEPDSATQAYEQVLSPQNEHVVDLRGLAMVTVDAQGKSHVDTPQRIVGTSTAHFLPARQHDGAGSIPLQA